MSWHQAAAHTNLEQPSLSLIKVICYPDCHRFQTQATRWGCDHEKTARESYLRRAQDHHLNFTVSESGLIINPKYPYLGATPDGCINCDCCEYGSSALIHAKHRHFFKLMRNHLFALRPRQKAHTF